MKKKAASKASSRSKSKTTSAKTTPMVNKLQVQPSGAIPEVDRIVNHIMNPDQKSAVWIVQMRDDPEGVTQRVDGLFFYESP